MKEKISIAFIVFIAALCLFGCKDELPQDEMIHGGKNTIHMVSGIM